MKVIDTNTETALLANEQIIQPLPEVIYHKHKALTTSLAVAKFFGKRHDNILQAIKKLDCSDDFRRLNFKETYAYRDNPNGGGRIKSPIFQMTRSGFVFLAMGFTTLAEQGTARGRYAIH